MRQTFIFLLTLQLGVAAASQSTSAPADADPQALLTRAIGAMGFAAGDQRVLHYHASAASVQNYQSDRSYPPYFSNMSQQEIWVDPSTGVMRVQSQDTFPGAAAPSVQVDDGVNTIAVRGERTIPVPRRIAVVRGLNPMAVLLDWLKATDVRVVGTESFRDYPRRVLSRRTATGEQRLFLDVKSGFPVKLDYMEPHYLWGQRHIEYLWSTWIEKDGISLPGAAFRLADGDVEISQTIGENELITREAAPSLASIPSPQNPVPDLPTFLQAIPPTVTQAAPNVWLLSNPGYNEAVTLAQGEVYVFDATQSEDRARQDAAEIAKLFPGRHKVNVVVTDTAWPHVSGLRYWVAHGATVVSHPGNRAFLQQIVDRRWTLAPDELEQLRKRDPKAGKMKFISVDRPQAFADGAIRLIPIDGIGSELALMAYVAPAKFVWASDYVQSLDEPTLYAAEVIRAAERAGIEPEHFAAQHVKTSEWKKVQAAQLPSATNVKAN